MNDRTWHTPSVMVELLLDNCRIDKRYDIVCRLGAGSYSEIFLATDNFSAEASPRRSVVIKALNVALQDDVDSALERTLIENFQNEALSLDRVRHPNIVSRLGHGTARDLNGTVFHYIVLEYMPGGDLQQRIRKGPLGVETCRRYIEQVCAGLRFAHSRGVIHRDIKPHNLLLSGDLNTVKVTDFGVARGVSSARPVTRVGSDVYAPPEHSPLVSAMAGPAERIGPSSDIYSLAKTVYAMMTGEVPRKFTGKPITELPAMEYRPQALSGLISVLQRATLDDPQSRYPGIDEFWADLSNALASISDGEVETVVSQRYVAPQPYVSRGYNPVPPQMPAFANDMTFRHGGPILDPPQNPAGTGPKIREAGTKISPSIPQKRRSRLMFLFRSAAAIVVLGTIAGGIYGTASWLGSLKLIPDVVRPYVTSSAIASSDVYLRSTPNTDNPPIGIVTKRSRLRVIKVQDNWYQVEILSQGRRVDGAIEQGRGWVNGKYLEL